MVHAEAFRAWALAPERTNDELFTVELLVERAEEMERSEQKIYGCDWEALHVMLERRRLNPAYRPRITRERLETLIARGDALRRFDGNRSEDRRVGDVAALQFFPRLEAVELRSRLVSIAPLAGLRGLKKVTLHDKRLEDLGPLAGLAEVEEVNLTLGAAWPDVRALGELPRLRRLTYDGNLLALEDIEALPEVRQARFKAGLHVTTPLRDLQRVPAMAKVARLEIEGVARLHGVERYAPYVLDVAGEFIDLDPLAGCARLGCLRLRGEHFADLTPLTRLPALRELWLERARGLDLAPLTDAPQLREVRADHCEVLKTELAATNALLTPWASDFLLVEARRRPLRFFSYRRTDPVVKALIAKERPGERAAFYGEDTAFPAAEERFIKTEVHRRMTALLGAGWTQHDLSDKWSDSSSLGHHIVVVSRYQDTLRANEIVRMLYALLDETRFPWEVLLSVHPHGSIGDDMEDIEAREGVFDAERQREEWEYQNAQQREREEFLEREHRFNLMREQTEAIDPAQFAPPGVPEPERKDADETRNGDAENEWKEDDRSLGARLAYQVSITADGVWISDFWFEASVEGVDAKPVEDWHKLPEPPEARPRPPCC